MLNGLPVQYRLFFFLLVFSVKEKPVHSSESSSKTDVPDYVVWVLIFNLTNKENNFIWRGCRNGIEHSSVSFRALFFFPALSDYREAQHVQSFLGESVGMITAWRGGLTDGFMLTTHSQEVRPAGVSRPETKLQRRLQRRIRRVPSAARPRGEHHQALHSAQRSV